MDFDAFDLNLLRVLDALLATHSVSGAAQRLGLSQPATSAALNRLRQVLGDSLLTRSGNRMAATPLANALRPHVTRALDEVRQALNAADDFDPSTTRRKFRIAANDYAALVLLAPLVQRLRQQAPHAMLEVLPLEGTLEHLADASLLSRDVDAVIADRWSLRGVRGVERIFGDVFTCVARANHPRLSRRVTLQQFLAEDHALVAPRGSTPGRVDVALERLGQRRRVVLTLPHMLAAPAVVAGSDLIMTLPRRIVMGHARGYHLRMFSPPLELDDIDITMAFHASGAAQPAIRWLREQVLAVVPRSSRS